MQPRGPETIPERYQLLAKWAKRVKDARVARGGPDDPGDIVPHVNFWRDGQVAAVGFARNVNRDEGLDLAFMGRRAFGADRMEVLLDAHYTDHAFVDRYGRYPDPHELQDLCDNEGACEIGLTTDCIICIDVDAGHMVQVMLPYHVDRRMEELEPKVAKAIKGDERDHIKREGTRYTRVTRSCHWQDDKIAVIDEAVESDRLLGTVPDGLRAAFAVETLAETVAKEGLTGDLFGLSTEETRLHMDIVGTRMLAQLGFVVGLTARDDEADEIIRRSMARHQSVKMFGPDGEEIPTDPEAQSDLTDLLADVGFELLRQKMEAERQRVHAEEEALRERRRAARVDGQATEEDRARIVTPESS